MIDSDFIDMKQRHASPGLQAMKDVLARHFDNAANALSASAGRLSPLSPLSCHSRVSDYGRDATTVAELCGEYAALCIQQGDGLESKETLQRMRDFLQTQFTVVSQFVDDHLTRILSGTAAADLRRDLLNTEVALSKASRRVEAAIPFM